MPVNKTPNIEILNRYLARKAREEAEREKAEAQEQAEKPAVETQAPTSFKDSGDYWQVQGVNYRNGIYTVNLLKSLLANGSSKTQEQWAEYSNKAKEKGEFYVGDMPLYHALFTSLHTQKNNPQSKQEIEQSRAFIQKQMRENWLTTLTRIAYSPEKDKIIHNFQMPGQYSLEENIIGPSREITDQDKPALKALIGAENINEIKQVYQWLNQTPTWIWRVNSKPKSIDERVARFDAYSGKTYLYCSWYSRSADASLGVFLFAEGARQKNPGENN